MRYKEKKNPKKCFADMKDKCFALVEKKCEGCLFYKERAQAKASYMRNRSSAKNCNVSWEIDKYFRSL